MSTSTSPRLRFLLVVGLLFFGLLGAACSDDSGGEAADTTSEGEPAAEPELEAWCAEVRRGLNALPSEMPAAIEAQAAAAPEDLAADYEVVLDMVVYRDENPQDILGVAEQQEAAGEPLVRILQAVQERCGITVPIFG